MTNGFLDEIAVEAVREFEKNFIAHLKLREKKLLSDIADKKEVDEKMTKGLEKATKEFVSIFSQSSKGAKK